jgi:XTP/dITP diphosphohydrolase
MTRLLLATRNAGKLRELRQLLGDEPISLETLAEHPDVDDVEETGKTFEENARIKAIHAARETGLWTFGEDSGLVVDALDGAPGVYSARYAGTHGDDEANNRKLVAALVGKTERTARYVCSLVLAAPDGTVEACWEEACEGTIAEERRGEGGFGYDPFFVPRGETRTMAELAPEEKARISHRGAALRASLPLLREKLG